MVSNPDQSDSAVITKRYTLLTHIPVYVFDDGTVRTMPLWHKDLQCHLDYLVNLHLSCPVLTEAEAGDRDLNVIEHMTPDRVHHVAQNIGWLRVALNIVPHFFAMGRVARDSDIVQGGAAGWPFPMSFYLLFWRRIYRFKWLFGVESSFWRLEPGETGSLRKRIAHRVHMFFVPRCLRAADAAYFTQSEYRDTLLGRTENTLINPAVWYEEEDLETPARLAERHADRDPSAPARALFPARMEVEKGVHTVIEAVRRADVLLPDDSPGLEVDFIGEGGLAAEAREFAANWTGRIKVRFLNTVPYGPEFFALLRGYDTLVLANRKAEQPRIVFDAFSQGVPLILSETSGALDIVRPGVDVETFPVDDVAALSNWLVELAADPGHFAKLGRAGLQSAGNFTIRKMHEDRRDFLIEVFGTGT